MHGASLLPSHTRAIADILACRTEALGGHRWRCTQCGVEVHSYHSCKNRSCPTCHRDETERWLAARKTELLPCPYFHVTVTVPADLRDVLRANQKDGYAALMRAAAQSIIELARDKRYAGGTVGVLAVMHTWTGQLVSTCTASSPAAACRRTGPAGVRRGPTIWRRLERSQTSCAASSGPRSPSSAPTSLSPRRCGASPGSCTARPGATAPTPCSSIWRAMSTA